MRALMDLHPFRYTAQVPWPTVDDSNQIDWDLGVHLIENWLTQNVGSRLASWAWDDGDHYQLGVGFRWEQHKTLFVLRWQ
jgi:hypothetical protein